LFDGSAINTCGNINHFTGLTFTRGLNDPPDSHNRMMPVSGISGACFAMRKDDYLKLGGFDERFFVYNEDSEFSWRAHSHHYSIVYTPSSVMRHDYTFRVSPQKMYHLEKGRYLILKTYLSWKMSVVLAPSLILAEILTFGYAVQMGWTGITLKIRAFYEGIFLTGNSQHRKETGVLEHMETQIPMDQLVSNRIERAVIRMGNWVFSWNYAIFRCLFIRKE
jgi:GT2 family glycosyltransferase